MPEDTIDAEFKEQPQSAALVVREQAELAAIRDEAGLEAALRKWRLYQRAVKELLEPTDYQQIEGRNWKKKTAWKKLAKAMRVSTHTVRIDERYVECGDTCPSTCRGRHYEALVTARAIDPDGLEQDGSGSCIDYEDFLSDEQFEKKKADFKRKGWNEPKRTFIRDARHDVVATAETRAAGRAIANLIAAGEVTAEEVKKGRSPEPPTENAPPPRTEAPVSTNHENSSTAAPDKPEGPRVGQIREAFLATGRGDHEWPLFVTTHSGVKPSEKRGLNSDERTALMAAVRRLPQINADPANAKQSELGV